MSDPPNTGPFSLTPASVPFAVIPGLVLMFTVAPASDAPFALTGFFAAFLGAIVGMLVYRGVRDYGPFARIGALTVLVGALYLVGRTFTGAG